MARLAVPFTFSAGAVAIAADVNSNFQSIVDWSFRIGNDNIAQDAGIDPSKLAAPFNVVHVSYTSDLAAFTNSVSKIYVAKHVLSLPANRSHFLIYGYAYARAVSAATNRIYIEVNSTVIGGGSRVITAQDTTYTVKNANPWSNPLISLADGDSLNFAIDASAGTPTFNNLTIGCFLKCYLTG